MKYKAYFTGLLVVLMLCSVAHAADSPAFRGPNRDGKFEDTGLLKKWPAGGPPVAWVAEGLGESYASVTVSDGKIYAPSMVDGQEGVIQVLDLDGNIVKTMPYGKEVEDKFAPGARSSLTIDGKRGYIMSGFGVLSCLDLDTGGVVWALDTFKKFGGQQITWKIAESVLVDGDLVVCTPGGPDASLVALNKNTGETVWTTKGFSEKSAYCSPDVIERGGRRIVLTMTAKSVVGVDIKTGEVLWSYIHETAFDIHAVTPVYADGMIYYTGGYKSGGGMLKLSEDGTSITPGWTDKTLDVQHHGVVLLDGYIYGTTHQLGRKMVCLELKTGKAMWETNEITQAVVIYADGMLYTYEGPKAGIVSLIKATPEKFERVSQFTVTQGTGAHWAHPTIANGRLYIRHGDALIAYDIAQK